MNTNIFCFVVLFASALALPLIDDVDDVDDVFGDDFGSNSNLYSEEDFDDRIIGGNVTTIEQHPHQVSFRMQLGSTHMTMHRCGGSILTPTRALTAAHCLRRSTPPRRYRIMAGSTFLNGTNAKTQRRVLNRFLVHPQYGRPIRLANDIAILYWERPLTFGSTVQAIALPSHGIAVPYGTNSIVTGWGRTRLNSNGMARTLKVTRERLITPAACRQIFGQRISDDMVCAGEGRGGVGPCHGDSGGPLSVNNVLFGVVSWGGECARPGFTGVFARVPVFVNWIRENL